MPLFGASRVHPLADVGDLAALPALRATDEVGQRVGDASLNGDRDSIAVDGLRSRERSVSLTSVNATGASLSLHPSNIVSTHSLSRSSSSDGDWVSLLSRCRLTGQIMTVPVLAPDGWLYEREAIAEYLEQNGTLPESDMEATAADLILDRTTRDWSDALGTSDGEELEEGPACFYCPITLDIMVDPVLASDESAYDLAELTEAYGRPGFDSERGLQGRSFASNRVVRHRPLRNAIASWHREQGNVTEANKMSEPPENIIASLGIMREWGPADELGMTPQEFAQWQLTTRRARRKWRIVTVALMLAVGGVSAAIGFVIGGPIGAAIAGVFTAELVFLFRVKGAR